MVFKGNFFSLHKQVLEYRVFIKEIYNLRGSLLQTAIVNRGNSCKPKPKKSFLSCVSEQSYISFLEFSKCTNLEWFFFLIFPFASQRRLLELLSYGEYNQLFISVIAFWKQLIYLLLVSMHLFFPHVE